jgi:hypothetical protein
MAMRGFLLIGVALTMGVAGARAAESPAVSGSVPPIRWTGTIDSLERAVKDLTGTFGARYPKGPEYLERLEALKKSGVKTADSKWGELGTEALLANPLLDSLRLVFVKRRNFGGHDGFFGYTSYLKRSPAELCVLEAARDGRPVRTLLRTDAGCLRDPDVSFDGRRVVFAYARDLKDDYHLYEIGADGAGVRQLTTSPPYDGFEPSPRAAGCQDVEPCYLPSGEIAFVSTRTVRYVDCVDIEPVTTLFVMDGDGVVALFPPRRVEPIYRDDPRPGPPRAFGFAREVQPVLDRHCVRCHHARDKKGLDLRGDATNWFSLAYENLRPFVTPIGPQGAAAIVPPRSQGAVASRLVDLLLAGHEDVRLDPESLDRIITWIDLNIPYYDSTAVTRPSNVALSNQVTGSGRALVCNAKPLWDALGDRCQGCHPRGFRIDPARAPCKILDLPKTMTRPCVNFTHPEESRILTAPLARDAGGLELCGKAVLANREDPTYRAALQVIQTWHDDLVARPREDMPGSVPCEAYKATQAKRQVWLGIEAETRRALEGP